MASIVFEGFNVNDGYSCQLYFYSLYSYYYLIDIFDLLLFFPPPTCVHSVHVRLMIVTCILSAVISVLVTIQSNPHIMRTLHRMPVRLLPKH